MYLIPPFFFQPLPSNPHILPLSILAPLKSNLTFPFHAPGRGVRSCGKLLDPSDPLATSLRNTPGSVNLPKEQGGLYQPAELISFCRL
jgi:hypothetical protein